MKTNFKKLTSFLRGTQDYIVKISADDKIAELCKKGAEKLAPVATKIAEDIEKEKEKIRIKNAKLDEDGCVMFSYEADGRRKYKMTPEVMIKCEEDMMALLDKEIEITFKPHFVSNSSVPVDLHESFIEALRGFVIEHNYRKPAKKEIEE